MSSKNVTVLNHAMLSLNIYILLFISGMEFQWTFPVKIRHCGISQLQEKMHDEQLLRKGERKKSTRHHDSAKFNLITEPEFCIRKYFTPELWISCVRKYFTLPHIHTHLQLQLLRLAPNVSLKGTQHLLPFPAECLLNNILLPLPSGPNLFYWEGVTQATNQISPWWHHEPPLQQFQVLFSSLLPHILYQALSHWLCLHWIVSHGSLYSVTHSWSRQGQDAPMTTVQTLKDCNTIRNVLSVNKIKHLMNQNSQQF